MQTSATALLKRLRSLEEGDGIRRATSLSRILFVIGLLLAQGLYFALRQLLTAGVGDHRVGKAFGQRVI